jgi:hypothetical protein
MSQQSKRWAIRIGWLILAGAIIFAALLGTIMSRVDEPKYTVIETDGNIQIRDYGPILVAEVEVSGERMKAINQGFRIIADYIFGNNAPAQKIAMTAPVTQQAGEKIAMTAPVTQQGSGDVWKVRFVMPQNYTLETIPKPNNQQVRLLSNPAKRFAVIRFSGFNTDRNINSHLEKLRRYVSDHKLISVGEPIMAFYNPPWTLPFLKRNEVMLELK